MTKASNVFPDLKITHALRRSAIVLIALASLLLSIGCSMPSSTRATAPAGEQRLVVVGGSATEIVYALGAGDKVVGVDTSSVYPEPRPGAPASHIADGPQYGK